MVDGTAFEKQYALICTEGLNPSLTTTDGRKRGRVWFIALAWRAGGPKGPAGSNPAASANGRVLKSGLRGLFRKQLGPKGFVGSNPTPTAKRILR